MVFHDPRAVPLKFRPVPALRPQTELGASASSPRKTAAAVIVRGLGGALQGPPARAAANDAAADSDGASASRPDAEAAVLSRASEAHADDQGEDAGGPPTAQLLLS